MLLNTFYFVVIISGSFLLDDAVSVVIISSVPSRTLTAIPRKTCSIPDSREYVYLSLEGNKLNPEKCYDGSGAFVIRVNCFDDSKIIEPDSFAVCFNGRWYPSAHTCVHRTCEPVNDTHSTRHTCSTPKGVEVNCRLPAVPGTKITIQCAHWRYGFENFKNSTVLERFCQKSGQWQTLEECTTLSCLTRNPATSNDSLFEKNSSSRLETANRFPWNSVIYGRKHDEWYQVCFGTLITNLMVLTSSNCLPINLDENPRYNGNIRVAVGNYFKNYKDYDQNQIYDVMTSFNFIDTLGLAFVIVSKHIEFSDTVGFTCLGSRRLPSDFEGTVGHVPISENYGNQFALPLPYLSNEDCQIAGKYREKIPHEYCFCSPTKNHTFVPDELGGGLISFQHSHGELIGVLFDFFNNGLSYPIFIDIGNPTMRFFIEKIVREFYDSIGRSNEYWSRRWGL